jgi:ribonuclease Z
MEVVFSVTILGSNSAIPTLKRNPTSQLVNHNERLFLVDCAEGTQLQLRRSQIKMQRINHILISHLHGDHFFGLIGLISSMHLLGRSKELHIYGLPKLKEILDIQLNASQTELIYPLNFHPVNPEINEIIYEDNKLTISTIPMNHRIPTCGFLFREKKGQRRIRKQAIKDHNLAVEDILKIREGSDHTDTEGKLLKNSELTDHPNSPRSYAFCSDTAYSENILPIIQQVNLLYHEATFMQEKADVAAEKFHSTTIEAATIARKAQAGRLIIGHFSTRYENIDEMLEEARSVFPETEAAYDGKKYEIE